MARFEKITKIDGYEVTFLTSFNDMDIYRDTGDSATVWLVRNGQVIFSFYDEHGVICVAEEFMNL
jgi:hypothetical protein